MPGEWFTIDRDHTAIECRRWLPDVAPHGTVQIVHGAAEHCARYDRVAAALTTAGFAVYAHDQRGHGRTADLHGTLGVARPGGFTAMVADAAAIADHIEGAHPGRPIVLMGHSMGSFVAQAFAQRWGDRLAGLVLSGTSGGLEGGVELREMLAGIEVAEGPDAPSAVWTAMTAGFNEAFDEPTATGSEWLSRDPAEVRAYVDDPWCGHDLSNGFVTDLVGAMVELWTPDAESGLPQGLPVLMIAGDADPVGGEGALVRALADRYTSRGLGPVTLRLYPSARHEVLNETNRDEVTDDLLAWLDDVVPR